MVLIEQLEDEKIVEIQWDHVLSRLHVFEHPIRIGGFLARSIEQVLWAICLAQHHMFNEAYSYWKNHPMLIHQATNIEDQVKRLLNYRGVKINPIFLMRKKKIIQQICRELMEHGQNEFCYTMQHIFFEYGPDVEFVAVSESDERMWNSGYKPNEVPEKPDRSWKPMPGFNQYGEALQEVFEQYFTTGFDRPEFDVRLLMTENVLRADFGFSRSVLIVSDSTLKHLKYVEGGSVRYDGGLTWEKALLKVREVGTRYTNYRFIIFSLGTNDSMRSATTQIEGYELLYEVLRALRHSDSVVLISSGIGVPKWEEVPAYTDWFADNFYRDFGNDDRYCFMDWSRPAEWNPFLDPNGRPIEHFFRQDKRHLNPSGVRKMWQCWCNTATGSFQDLKSIRMQTDKKEYSAGRLRDF